MMHLAQLAAQRLQHIDGACAHARRGGLRGRPWSARRRARRGPDGIRALAQERLSTPQHPGRFVRSNYFSSISSRPIAMDENELRRKALESMMRKKGEPKGTGAGKEDGEVEDEGGAPAAAAATKSKCAGDGDTAASPQQGAGPLLTPACPLPPRLLLLLHLLPS